MSKKKFDFKYLFPLLCIIFPFVSFFIISLIKYINSGIFNYTNNFIYFFDCLKSVKEYIFPTILFLTLGLAIVVISKLFSKKIKSILWIFLIICGIIIILIGNRMLFIISNSLWNQNVIVFLCKGLTPYTFTLSTELTLLVCSILYYFNSSYLK